MAVGAMETVAAVKTCGSAELLGKAASWEDALLHWVNEVRSEPEKTTACFRNRPIFSFRGRSLFKVYLNML